EQDPVRGRECRVLGAGRRSEGERVRATRLTEVNSMTCSSSHPVVCTGGNNASVYLPQYAARGAAITGDVTGRPADGSHVRNRIPVRALERRTTASSERVRFPLSV